MSRKQIGLRMKDETRDQLERVRGGLSRTDYIEGAVLAQIARDLKRNVTVGVDIPGGPISIGPKIDVIEDERIPPNMAVSIPGGEVFVGGDKVDSEIIGDHTVLAEKNKPLYDRPIRSSAESKANVLPVPKKAVKGRK